jgi:hypothetical protein
MERDAGLLRSQPRTQVDAVPDFSPATPCLSRVERDARLLIFRAAAVAFWIACVLFIAVPRHRADAARFDGGKLPAPKFVPARGA